MYIGLKIFCKREGIDCLYIFICIYNIVNSEMDVYFGFG